MYFICRSLLIDTYICVYVYIIYMIKNGSCLHDFLFLFFNIQEYSWVTKLNEYEWANRSEPLKHLKAWQWLCGWWQMEEFLLLDIVCDEVPGFGRLRKIENCILLYIVKRNLFMVYFYKIYLSKTIINKC